MAMMFSVAKVCLEHAISRGLLYTLAKEGRGPKTVKLGRRTLVSHEAAEEWRRRMESPTRGGPDDGSEITQRPTIERGKAQSGVVGETLFSPRAEA